MINSFCLTEFECSLWLLLSIILYLLDLLVFADLLVSGRHSY